MQRCRLTSSHGTLQSLPPGHSAMLPGALLRWWSSLPFFCGDVVSCRCALTVLVIVTLLACLDVAVPWSILRRWRLPDSAGGHMHLCMYAFNSSQGEVESTFSYTGWEFSWQSQACPSKRAF